MSRLINNPKLINAGYNTRYIFVPVNDWLKDTKSRPWMYRDQITPMSILYHNAELNLPLFKEKYKDNIFVFINDTAYFKLDVNSFESKDLPIFKRFLTVLNNNEYVQGNVDDNKDSSRVIAMKIIDKIETSQNVDIHNLTGSGNKSSGSKLNSIANDKNDEEKIKNKVVKTSDKVVVKSEIDKRSNKEELVDVINNVSKESDSEDEALNKLDSNYIENIIKNLSAEEDNTVKISASRAARFNKLNDNLLKKEINGKNVKDLIESKPIESLPHH